ncbi:MAG: hypothetical protein O7C62_04850, partial [Rickettsia endosymbiont of Ixodes persulcatus]|nr:hypothetical protein [Rickettsia endosymbiont of Ixodes persulcatus]
INDSNKKIADVKSIGREAVSKQDTCNADLKDDSFLNAKLYSSYKYDQSYKSYHPLLFYIYPQLSCYVLSQGP